MDCYCFAPNQSLFQALDLERVVKKAENIFNFYLDSNWEFQFLGMDDIEIMIREVAGKESSVLCREVTSIGDAMDVIRSKWVPEILTAVNPYLHFV